MNITVIGAGAVGGYFGARLEDAGAKVTFLVRDKRQNQLEKEGLGIESINGDMHLSHPSNVTNVSDIDECELIILAVKGYHLDSVYSQLEPLVDKGAKILPLLNGVEHFAILEKQFGKDAVIGGLCYIISTLNNGHVVHSSKQHDIVFGPLTPAQEDICNRLIDLLTKANVNHTYTKQIMKEVWNKYAFITAYSGITTASRLEIGPIRNQAETLELYKEITREMKILAKGYDVDLGGQFTQLMLDKAFGFPEHATSSMHQDFRKGLPLELESLQGGALRMAEVKNISMPVTQTLYRLLKPFENGSGLS